MAQLVGRLVQNNITRMCTWEGEWWIIGQEASKSTFLYRSKKPSDNDLTSTDVVDGVYQGSGVYDGHFMMKNVDPAIPPAMIKEPKLKLTFTAGGDDLPTETDRKVSAQGKNQFGTFQITGWFRPSSGQIEVIKNYVGKASSLPPPPRENSRSRSSRTVKKKRPFSPTGEAGEAKKTTTGAPVRRAGTGGRGKKEDGNPPPAKKRRVAAPKVKAKRPTTTAGRAARAKKNQEKNGGKKKKKKKKESSSEEESSEVESSSSEEDDDDDDEEESSEAESSDDDDDDDDEEQNEKREEEEVKDHSLCMSCWDRQRNVSYSCPKKHLAVCKECHYNWLEIQRAQNKEFHMGLHQKCFACQCPGEGIVHSFTFAS
jgi:hypothetical protein